MKKIPQIGAYLDEEERELFEAIESDDYEVGESGLTPEKAQALQKVAKLAIEEGVLSAQETEDLRNSIE